MVSVATWTLASDYMFKQRRQSVTWQADVNVRLVDNALRTGSNSLDELLTGLSTPPDTTLLLRHDNRWITSGRPVELSSLPPQLLDAAHQNRPLELELVTGGIPVLAVSRPVPSSAVDAFIELFPLVELHGTLRFLRTLLIAGTGLSALLGFLLGAWASRRALRPLSTFTVAVSRVAAGDLTARLPPQKDPDLDSLATTFNDTTEALQHRVQRDARFAGDVSHELRSPLTTMINAGAMIRRRRQDIPESARRPLDLLLSEVDRFHQMVLDLLDIARDDQQTSTQDREPLNLADLVGHTATNLGIGTPIEVGTAEAPIVLADRRRLDRVVANLLTNAVRYGGGPVRVWLGHHEGTVRLEIDDAGPGVPPELRHQIFERFARGNRAGSRGTLGGTGLGLAIVADQVARHGGTTWVEDRPGGGARFIVQLPPAPT
ncbi:HAMP domain-containing histidine kinase [Amycolatopsis suaedae]|uniref:histidine kinase n=2 Tax=Amycolatopsis suaedae TaxID=2510978 RepID=A0A4Q7JCW6_9PSEU|nr:HAMP domain-containing histidine kinase [Amycolatopsis suaedae]